jgi:hypothetical protein
LAVIQPPLTWRSDYVNNSHLPICMNYTRQQAFNIMSDNYLNSSKIELLTVVLLK